jgi:hypothetical protein
MGFSQYIDLLPGSGYGGSGIGAPMFVGRNRNISTVLDITDAPSDAAVSVYLETAASQFAKTWRKLGTTLDVTGLGQTALIASGADAFVRARYVVALPSKTTAAGFGLAGQASLVLAPLAALTGAGVSSTIDLAQYHGGRFAALVSAAPGGGQTLALTIERSGDGNAWQTAASWPSIAAAGEYALESADLDRFVRVRRAPSGVGSWTLGVAGTSHLIYARVRDRAALGIRNAAIPNTTTAQYLGALLSATKIVSSYYTRYDHPLRSWEEDTQQATIALADWAVLTTVSKDPARTEEGGGIYVAEADRWTTWLRQVGGLEPGTAGRKLVPSHIVDSAPANEAGEVKRWSFESTPLTWGNGGGGAGV